MRNGSLIRRRQLARILRELRLKAGMTIEAAAPLLDFSPSKLSRIENAHQGVDVHAVRSMMDIFGVGGDRWGELLDLTREANAKGWWRAYGLDDTGYVPLEAEASAVRDFTVSYVPGLLQTADYARAVFVGSLYQRSEETLAQIVAVRMIRQDRLISAAEPLKLLAVVEEAVLHRPVGGRDLMRAQLRRLVAAAALDTVTLQVLPTGFGAHAGINGAFTLLSFDGLGEPDVGYVEHPVGSVHIEKEEHVERARLVFDHLRSVALSQAESVALVERVAAQL